MRGQRLQVNTPQGRDRMLQVYLAQARGPARNGDLLRSAMDRMVRLRSMRHPPQEGIAMEDTLVETLEAAVRALEAAGVVYAVTGSIASSVHSEPLMSEDVDLIVHASVEQARAVARALSPRFYAPEDMLVSAAEKHSFTNVVDNRTSLKVDFSFVPSAGYLGAALARRVKQRIGMGMPEFWFVTAEDVILMKLVWRKDTRSAKQWDNALSVARVKGARMDWKYLFEQAKKLGVEEDLERLRDEAGI